MCWDIWYRVGVGPWCVPLLEDGTPLLEDGTPLPEDGISLLDAILYLIIFFY